MDQSSKKRVFITVGIAVTIAMTVITVALLMNIFEKKKEAKNPFFNVVELSDEIEDPKIWGQNFPHQYDSYLKTVDQVRTRYGGSEAVPRTPTEADPRSVVSQSKLEEDPRLKIMWAGYAFSKDFREERGHAFMFIDQLFTLRQNIPQPGTCLNCHASTVYPMKKLGGGDLTKGYHAINELPYHEAKNHIKHPIACIDCHTPRTMELRVTRPAFMEGIRKYKEHLGIKNFDVNAQASRQEMRTFVCAQCHVEYYFKGPKKELVYPWSKGLKADEILAYYEEENFKDWVHSETKAPLLKAQHPEFELWSQGIHARASVSCVDCHMPYQRVGAAKITDHHIKSPILMINRSCQTCHHVPESELKFRVETIQHRHFQLRNVAMEALMDLIEDMKTEKNKSSPRYLQAQKFQRKAQFLLDFVEAENSTGFHAPQEAARILGLSIDHSRKGQVILKSK